MNVLFVELYLIAGIWAAFPRLPALYASNPDIPAWNSAHWSVSGSYTLNPRDKYDTTGVTQGRYNPPYRYNISGGVLTMRGVQPRLYLNPWVKPDGRHWPLRQERERLAAGRPLRFYKNTEVTVYYRRTGTDGASYAGLVLGCRSSPNGHITSTLYHEHAHTYYTMFRHDGLAQFGKEVTHPRAGVHKIGHLFKGQPLPQGEWIGMKFVVYNLDLVRVKLEVYIDRTSGGELGKISDANNWKKVGEMIDDGTNFEVDTFDGVDGKSAITEGGGVVFIRNTDIAKSEYKFFQVTEIQTPVQALFSPDDFSF